MNFEIKPIDITKLKCDAIVNSLGANKNVKIFGKICSNIVESCGSYGLKDEICSFEPEAIPGKIFVTSGYHLRCKHIVHIVTPCFAKDPQLIALEYVYREVLLLAVKNNWKHLAIPIIGTGANGYPSTYTLKMVTNLVKTFTDTYKKIQVTICVPVVSSEDYATKFNPDVLEKSIKEFFDKNPTLNIREFNYTKEFFTNAKEMTLEEYAGSKALEVQYPSNIRREDYNYANSFEFINELQALLDYGNRPVKVDFSSLGKLYSVTNYIDNYIEKRFSNEDQIKKVRRHVNKYLNGSEDSTSLRSKHNDPKKRTTISTHVLMRYILALHMTMEEANDFLKFCGRSFSPVPPDDCVYQILIKSRIFDDSKANDCCVQEGATPIFYSDEK